MMIIMEKKNSFSFSLLETIRTNKIPFGDNKENRKNQEKLGVPMWVQTHAHTGAYGHVCV